MLRSPPVIKSFQTYHGKTTLKIFFSETIRLRAYILRMRQCLAIPCIRSANHTPGINIGHAGLSLALVDL